MSNCKGLEQTVCKQRPNCTYVNGKTRKYCKNNSNSLANQYKELKQQYNEAIEDKLRYIDHQKDNNHLIRTNNILLDEKEKLRNKLIEFKKDKEELEDIHNIELIECKKEKSYIKATLTEEINILTNNLSKFNKNMKILEEQNKDLLKQYNELIEENIELKENYNELIDEHMNSKNELKEERLDIYDELCDLEKLLKPNSNNDTEDSLFVKNYLKNFEKLKNKLKTLKTHKASNPKSLKNRYKKTMKRR